MAELSLAQLEKKAGNGQSPLFARLAGMYLDQGKAREALTVCEAGLASYPYYVTGHLLKGKALLALSMRTEARREFEWVHGFLPGNPAVTRLLEQVPPAAEESLSAPPADSHVEFVPKAKAAAPPPPVSDAAASFGFSTEPSAAADFGFTPLTPAPAASDMFGSFGAPGGQDATETPAPPPAFDSMFGLPADAPAATDFGLPASEPPAFSGLDEFSHDSAASSFDALSAFATPQAQEPSPFEFSGPSESSPSPSGSMFSEEESFDQYASRMRNELTGEGSVTIEQYLGSPQAPPPPQSDPIADLAQKLQTAKRMTPAVETLPPPPATPVINFSAKTVPTATESETPASTGFVTPTLAEIYAKQGWYDDAIKAYRTLANNKPADRDRFLKRIEELEELKSQQGG